MPTNLPIDYSVRILIVDDMPAVRSIVRNMLEEMGFTQITEAEDGELAWHLIQQASTDGEAPYALLIADWNMPGISGVDLLRSIRSSNQTRDLPFLMVTAQGDQSHLSEAFDAGVTDYIVKPFSPEQLIEKIRSIFLA